MAQDALGNEVSVLAEAELSGINDFSHGFLAYMPSIGNVSALATAQPDCVQAQVYAALLAMFSEQPQSNVEANFWLDRAQLAARFANDREQKNLAMISALMANDVPLALKIGDEIVEQYPHDLVVMKLHQELSFNLGDAPGMLRIAKLALVRNADNPYVHGMAAFGYEQCHLLGHAENAARAALEIQFAEPWAQHALAHVMLTQGRVPEGITFLNGARETWSGLNSFMYTHNWWHMALFYISVGDFQTVLDIYDAHCWSKDRDFSQDQIGAVSLLARLELAGGDVGQRWADLGQYLKLRQTDCTQPFLTMQYIYGLAKAELSEAEILLEAVKDRAAGAAAFEKSAWADVALPACLGLLAHARGDFEAAIAHLSQSMPRMMEIGGSHAQRDLFAQVLLDAHIQAGRFSTAQQMLESRRRFDPNGAPLNRMLASVYEKLGLLDEADEALTRKYELS